MDDRTHPGDPRSVRSDDGTLPAELPGRVYSKELMELIFTQPYVKIKFLMDAGIGGRKAASEYLKALEQIGVLVGERHGREIVYRHQSC